MYIIGTSENENPIAGSDVIAYVDLLERNFATVTDGNRIRALCIAIVAVESDRCAGSDPCRRQVYVGLDFLDAVIVLLRDRLSRASRELLQGGVWEQLVDDGAGAERQVGA